MQVVLFPTLILTDYKKSVFHINPNQKSVSSAHAALTSPHLSLSLRNRTGVELFWIFLIGYTMSLYP